MVSSPWVVRLKLVSVLSAPGSQLKVVLYAAMVRVKSAAGLVRELQGTLAALPQWIPKQDRKSLEREAWPFLAIDNIWRKLAGKAVKPCQKIENIWQTLDVKEAKRLAEIDSSLHILKRGGSKKSSRFIYNSISIPSWPKDHSSASAEWLDRLACFSWFLKYRSACMAAAVTFSSSEPGS